MTSAHDGKENAPVKAPRLRECPVRAHGTVAALCARTDGLQKRPLPRSSGLLLPFAGSDRTRGEFELVVRGDSVYDGGPSSRG